MLGYGDFDTVMDVVAKAVAKGPYLMGEQFTAADVVIGSDLRWGMMFNLLPKRPSSSTMLNGWRSARRCNGRRLSISNLPLRESLSPMKSSGLGP